MAYASSVTHPDLPNDPKRQPLQQGDRDSVAVPPVPHRRAPVKKSTSAEFAVKCTASLSLARLYGTQGIISARVCQWSTLLIHIPADPSRNLQIPADTCSFLQFLQVCASYCRFLKMTCRIPADFL